MSDLLVSVIMPVHNSGRYLRESVDSILEQTYENIELVAADGGSGDDTIEILEGYAKAHPGRVRVLRGRPGSGVCVRRAAALNSAEGELIAWLDSDDLWHPEKTAKQVRLLEERSEVDVVFSYFDAFDSDSDEVLAWPEGRRGVGGDMLSQLFVEGCFLGALTALIRKPSLDERGLRLRTSEFSFGDDYYLWLSLAATGGVFAQIPEVLARYRRHRGNQSSRDQAANSERSRAALLGEFLDEFPQASDQLGPARREGLSFAYGRAARFAADHGHRLEAGGLALASARHSPGAFWRGAANRLRRRNPTPALAPVAAIDPELAPAVSADTGEPLLGYWHRRLHQSANERYAGVQMAKFPEDLRVYEQLLWISRADTVIEIGTAFGASALWFRDRLRALEAYGRIDRPPSVISIDIDVERPRELLAAADPTFDREIELIAGDVTDPELPESIEGLVRTGARCLVIEDSAHVHETTLGALMGFARFVPVGGFFVVEDGYVDIEELRPPQWPDAPRGVLPALEEWLRTEEGRKFERRVDLEVYGITSHPGGFLRRVRG